MNQESSTLDVPALQLETGVISLRRAAVRGGAALVGSRLAVQILTWGVTLLVARFLRPYDYGILASGAILLGLADLMAEAGIGRALIQKQELARADLDVGFTLNLGLALAMYLVVFWGAAAVAAFFRSPELVAYIRVAGLGLLIMPLRVVPLALLHRDLRLGSESVIYTTTAVVQASLTLALAASGFGYWSLVGGGLAARLLEVGLLARRVAWAPRLRWSGTAARRLLAFGGHVSGASFLWYFYSNSDYAVLGRVVGPVELGYYALAFQLISLPVQKLTGTLNLVAFPVYCRLQHDRPRMRDWYLRSTVLLGFLGLPALVGLGLVAPETLTVVLGSKWTPSVVPLQCLCVVGILKIYIGSLSPLFNAIGRPDVNTYYTLTCFLVMPGAFALGATWWGVMGVCVAWVALYPLLITGLIVATRRITEVSLLDLLRRQVPVVLAVLVMAAAVLAIRRLIAGRLAPDASLLAYIAVGMITYGAAAITLAQLGLLEDLRRIWAELRGKVRPPESI